MSDRVPTLLDDLSDTAIAALRSKIADQCARLPRLRAGDMPAAIRNIRDEENRLMLLLRAREAASEEGCAS
jgi:hypothetical protein